MTMISSSSDVRVSRVIASEVVDLGLIPEFSEPKTQKLVFTASAFTRSIRGTVLLIMVMTIFKT